MARPTVLYDWAKDNYLDDVYNVSNKISIPVEFQSSGVLREQPVPAQYLNSYLNNTNEWIKYLDNEIQSGGGLYVPITRKINGKQLNTDITLTASNVGAVPNNNTYSITLGGDLTGSATFSTNSVSLTATVQDNSHLHTVPNISGLQDKLDDKLGKLEEAASALSAKLLVPASRINGTTFNNSGDITTSYWGATRTFTIGASAKSLNGASNVSWSLSEMGVYGDTRNNIGTGATNYAAGNHVHTHSTTTTTQTNLYTKAGGLDGGNFTLSQPYDSYDEILVFGSPDNSAVVLMKRFTPVQINLAQGLNLTEGFELCGGESSKWHGVFGADKKTFTTKAQNMRIHKIVGIKYSYGA